MRINEIISHKIEEQATAGATSAGNIATVTSPHIAIGKDRFSKAYHGSPGKSGTRAPRLPKIAICLPKIDVATIIEKPMENQRF